MIGVNENEVENFGIKWVHDLDIWGELVMGVKSNK